MSRQLYSVIESVCLIHIKTHALSYVMRVRIIICNPDQRSWLDVAMVSINNHLQAFRMLPWVIGGVGALLLVRYSGMVSTRFDHVTVM